VYIFYYYTQSDGGGGSSGKTRYSRVVFFHFFYFFFYFYTSEKNQFDFPNTKYRGYKIKRYIYTENNDRELVHIYTHVASGKPKPYPYRYIYIYALIPLYTLCSIPCLLNNIRVCAQKSTFLENNAAAPRGIRFRVYTSTECFSGVVYIYTADYIAYYYNDVTRPIRPTDGVYTR
jgi:hypothetical protein